MPVHVYSHAANVGLDLAVKNIRAEWASARATFGLVGDGVTDDTTAFQNMVNDVDASGGGQIYLPGGYTYLVGNISFPATSNPLTIWGDGVGSLIKKKGTSTPSGTGWFDMPAGCCNKILQTICLDAARTSAPTGIDDSTYAGDPLHPSLSDNTTLWAHDGANNNAVIGVKFTHSAAYSVILEAQSADILNWIFQDILLENSYPSMFGYSGGAKIYGAWNSGILMHGNGTTGNPYACRHIKFIKPRINRINGIGIWSHVYGFNTQHEDITIDCPDATDVGRDTIEMGSVNGYSITNPELRRGAGYTVQDDTSASVPAWVLNQWGVGIDHAGECSNGSIKGGHLVSCNGGYIDGDGMSDCVIEGVECRTPRSTDPEYSVDGVGAVGWGGSLTAGRDFSYGVQPGNTQNTAFGGFSNKITGCRFINLSGGSYKGYASRNSQFTDNYLEVPANPAIVPIILGNVGSGTNQRATDNLVTGNKASFSPGSSVPLVFEDPNGFAFLSTDINWVYNNPITGNGNAFELLSDGNTSTTTKITHSSNTKSAVARSEHQVQREGLASASSSALRWYLQEGMSGWLHMQLQGYWKAGSRGPLLNISEGGTGGVIATGGRTTSVFTDAMLTGKLYADSIIALTDTTYADADADLLPATVYLLRFIHTTGYLEQSTAVSGGHRVWVPFTSAAAGSDTQVQVNQSGSLAGFAGLTFDYTNTILKVTPNTSALPAGLSGTVLQVAGANSTNARIVIDTFAGGSNLAFRHSAGTAASPAAVSTNEALGSVSFHGYGTSYTTSRALFAGFAAENWTGSANGAYLTFQTTPLGSATMAERMRIDSSGHVFINKTLDDSTGAVLQLAGFVSATTGYYTASSSAAAIQAPAGGVTALNLVVSRPSIPQAYNFQIDSGANLLLQDSTSGSLTRLSLSTAGLFSIGSTVQIDQSGNISASGAIQATGSSGAISVPTNTARNAVQSASGGVAGLFLHVFGQSSAPVTFSAAGTADLYYNSTSSTLFLSASGGAWTAITFGGITGSGTSAEIPFFTGTSVVSSSANLTWNNSTNIFGVGGSNTLIDSSGNISFTAQAAGNGTTGTNFNALSTSASAIQAASGGINASTGYSVGGTQFINSSRNLINIGSISGTSISVSGTIVSTGSTITANGSITSSAGAFISGVTSTTLGININSNFQVNGNGAVSAAGQIAANGTGTVINAPNTTANNSIQTNGGFNSVNGYFVSGNTVINSSGILSNSFGVDVNAGVAGTGFNIHGGGSGQTVTSGSFTSQTFTGGILTNFSTVSDSSLKNISGPYEYGLAELLRVRPMRYTWNGIAQSRYDLPNEKRIGLIAQDVQLAMPAIMHTERFGYLGFSQEGITAALINSIHELAAQNRFLTDRVAELESRLVQ